MYEEQHYHNLQSLSIYGICKESLRIIFSWKNIFLKISTIFIFPFSSMILGLTLMIHFHVLKILDHKEAFNQTPKGILYLTSLLSLISSQLQIFWFSDVVGVFYLSLIYLLSSSAIVYALASIYSGRDFSFSDVASTSNKLLKRLTITFMSNFAVVSVYNVVLGVLVLFWAAFVGVKISTMMLLSITYLMGFACVVTVCHLANVVTILENVRGFEAITRSKVLIKGKFRVAVANVWVVLICFAVIYSIFLKWVLIDLVFSLGTRIGVGIICYLLLLGVFLFGLVSQTVVYFVCKSYHREDLDESMLVDHSNVCNGDYVAVNDNQI